MDLAQEVIKKLISEDPNLQKAIKDTAQKFIKSKEFDNVIKSIVKDELMDELKRIVKQGNTTLDTAVDDRIKEHGKIYLSSPEATKILNAAAKKSLLNIDQDNVREALEDGGLYEELVKLAVNQVRRANG